MRRAISGLVASLSFVSAMGVAGAAVGAVAGAGVKRNRR
jgi:hypothetical protein